MEEVVCEICVERKEQKDVNENERKRTFIAYVKEKKRMSNTGLGPKLTTRPDDLTSE